MRPKAFISANGLTLLQKTATDVGNCPFGTSVSTGNSTTWSGTAQNDIGLALGPSGGAIQLNGGTVVADSTGRAPVAPFNLGSLSGSSVFFGGYISRLTLFNNKLTSPQ
jgi:hypothetical protein